MKCLSKRKPFVTLPSVISHLLQLLGGECCHLGTSLLQSPVLYWTQDCGYQLRMETQTNKLTSNYIVRSTIYCNDIPLLTHTHTQRE